MLEIIDVLESLKDGKISVSKAKKLLSVGEKIRSLEPGQFWLVPNTTNVE